MHMYKSEYIREGLKKQSESEETLVLIVFQHIVPTGKRSVFDHISIIITIRVVPELEILTILPDLTTKFTKVRFI